MVSSLVLQREKAMRVLRRAGGVLGVTVLGGLLWGPVAQAATNTFGYTGGEQQFIVPQGVTSLHVLAVGGTGGHGAAGVAGSGGAGGFGATAIADLAVNPGQLFYIEVGGNGASTSTKPAATT